MGRWSPRTAPRPVCDAGLRRRWDRGAGGTPWVGFRRRVSAASRAEWCSRPRRRWRAALLGENATTVLVAALLSGWLSNGWPSRAVSVGSVMSQRRIVPPRPTTARVLLSGTMAMPAASTSKSGWPSGVGLAGSATFHRSSQVASDQPASGPPSSAGPYGGRCRGRGRAARGGGEGRGRVVPAGRRRHLLGGRPGRLAPRPRSARAGTAPGTPGCGPGPAGSPSPPPGVLRWRCRSPRRRPDGGQGRRCPCHRRRADRGAGRAPAHAARPRRAAPGPRSRACSSPQETSDPHPFRMSHKRSLVRTVPHRTGSWSSPAGTRHPAWTRDRPHRVATGARAQRACPLGRVRPLRWSAPTAGGRSR